MPACALALLSASKSHNNIRRRCDVNVRARSSNKWLVYKIYISIYVHVCCVQLMIYTYIYAYCICTKKVNVSSIGIVFLLLLHTTEEKKMVENRLIAIYYEDTISGVFVQYLCGYALAVQFLFIALLLLNM